MTESAGEESEESDTFDDEFVYPNSQITADVSDAGTLQALASEVTPAGARNSGHSTVAATRKNRCDKGGTTVRFSGKARDSETTVNAPMSAQLEPIREEVSATTLQPASSSSNSAAKHNPARLTKPAPTTRDVRVAPFKPAARGLSPQRRNHGPSANNSLSPNYRPALTTAQTRHAHAPSLNPSAVSQLPSASKQRSFAAMGGENAYDYANKRTAAKHVLYGMFRPMASIDPNRAAQLRGTVHQRGTVLDAFKSISTFDFQKQQEASAEQPSAIDEFLRKKWAPAFTRNHRALSAWCILISLGVAVAFAYFGSNLEPPSREEQFFPDEHLFERATKEILNNFSSASDASLVEVAVVFGIDTVDRSGFDRWLPAAHRGSAIFHSGVNMVGIRERDAFVKTCERLRREACGSAQPACLAGLPDKIAVEGTLSCPLEEFHSWVLAQQGYREPTSDEDESGHAVFGGFDGIEDVNDVDNVPTVRLEDVRQANTLSDAEYKQSLLYYWQSLVEVGDERARDIGFIDGDLKFLAITFKVPLAMWRSAAQKLPIHNRLLDIVHDLKSAELKNSALKNTVSYVGKSLVCCFGVLGVWRDLLLRCGLLSSVFGTRLEWAMILKTAGFRGRFCTGSYRVSRVLGGEQGFFARVEGGHVCLGLGIVRFYSCTGLCVAGDGAHADNSCEIRSCDRDPDVLRRRASVVEIVGYRHRGCSQHRKHRRCRPWQR